MAPSHSRLAVAAREKYDASHDETLGKLVKGQSPPWIRVVMGILRVWFFVYDCLSYIPYHLFNSPIEKLRRSQRIKARFVRERDGPIQHVDGLRHQDFDCKDTIDKVWRHVVSLYGEKQALGTRPLLKIHEDKQADGRAFEKWELGDYTWLSYNEIEAIVGRISAGLKDLAPGDEAKVVLYAETRAHWLMTALACFRAKIPIVTVYATLGEDAIVAAITETDSTIIVTSSEQLEKIGTLGKRCPNLKTLIYMPPVNKDKQPNLSNFKEQFTNVFSFSELETRVSEPLKKSTAETNDTASILYTSGTTGVPKGVVLSHRNIVAAICGQGYGVGVINDKDVYIGYLPLAHILELDAELTCLARGCKVGYSSPLTLHDRSSKIQKGTHGDCYALRPTLMAAVPAIMDRIFKAVEEEVAAAPRFMQELFRLNYERKRARYQEGYGSPFMDRIVFKKIRQLLGGHLKIVL